MRKFNRDFYLLLCLSGRSAEAAAYMEEFKRGDSDGNGGSEKKNEALQADGEAHGAGKKRPVRGRKGADEAAER